VLLEHEAKGKLVGGEVGCIVTAGINDIDVNATFHIQLSIKIVTQASTSTVVEFG